MWGIIRKKDSWEQATVGLMHFRTQEPQLFFFIVDHIES